VTFLNIPVSETSKHFGTSCNLELKYSTRGSVPNALERETFNLEEGRSTTRGGLRMTTNSRMLNAIPETLLEMARS